MRIGILTFQFAVNYGAVIQLWALNTYLERKGHEVIVFNYEPYFHKYPRWILSAYSFILHPIKFLKQVCFSHKFSCFLRRHMKLSQRVYRGDVFPDLNLDVVLVGSDQVWNVSYFKDKEGNFDKTYFLDFVKNGNKVAYAASIGEGWGVKDAAEVKRLLASFDAISVRESFASRKLQELGFPSVPVVPDPTVLLDASDYVKVCAPIGRKKEPYIFVYVMGDPNKCFHQMLRILEERPTMSAYVVVLNRRIKVPLHRRVRQIWPSPEAWLDRLISADLIITNSFHGMMLSIVHRRPVIVSEKEGEKHGNDRMKTILDYLRFDFDRIVEYTDETDQLLDSFRKRGIHFLMNMGLQNIGEGLT